MEVEEPVNPDDTLAKRISSLGEDLSTFAMRLSAEMDLSGVFAKQLPKKCLHIIVQVPSTSACL